MPVELLSSPSTTDSQVNEPQNSQQKTETLDSGFPDITFPSRIFTPSPTLPHRPRGRTSTPYPDSNRTNVSSRSTPPDSRSRVISSPQMPSDNDYGNLPSLSFRTRRRPIFLPNRLHLS